jgi:hypothetical protein
MRILTQKQKPTREAVSAFNAEPGRAFSGQDPNIRLLADSRRSIGNQTAEKPLQPHAEELEDESPAQAMLRFAHDFSRIPVQADAGRIIQPKLPVSTTENAHEQEADRIAEQVLRMPEPQLQRTGTAGAGYPGCQNEQTAQRHLQTRRAQTIDSGESVAPPIVHDVLRSAGQSLDPMTRQFMEPRFGHDFSKVRVHTDAKAAASAAAVNALAYTVGRDLVFGAGQYQPATTAGKRLLAHELTHIVQQANGFQSRLAINQEGDHYEREADRTALAITQGTPSSVDSQTSVGVTSQLMRQKADDKPALNPPYFLPQVVITAAKTPPQPIGKDALRPDQDHTKVAPTLVKPLPTQTGGKPSADDSPLKLNEAFGKFIVCDVTFVKVQTREDALQRINALNQLAGDALGQYLLIESWKYPGYGYETNPYTLTDPSPEAALKARQDENRKDEETLKKQFGDGWGTFFWWIRGGGQTGEGAPLWSTLDLVAGKNEGLQNKAYETHSAIGGGNNPSAPKGKTYYTHPPK